MCVPVQAEAAGLSRHARFPVLEPRVVKHRGGRVVDLAQGGRNLVCPYLVVDLQSRQQNIPLGVGLGGRDRSDVKKWASMSDCACALCVRLLPGRLMDCSHG